MADKKNDPLAEAQKRQAEIVAEQEEAQSVVPTPTQEEIDRAKLGLVDGEKLPAENRSVEAEAPGTYKTRGK